VAIGSGFADIFLVIGTCAAIAAVLGLLLPGRERAAREPGDLDRPAQSSG
jgi:hypothetical protein